MTTDTDYGKTFKLDSDGDLSITSERIDMIEGGEKVSQDLKILLQTVVGENILHREMGLWIISDNPNVFTERSLEKQIGMVLTQYNYEIYVTEISVTIDNITRIATAELKIILKSGIEVEVHI